MLQQPNSKMCEKQQIKTEHRRENQEEFVKFIIFLQIHRFSPQSWFRSDHGIIYVSITSNIQMESDSDSVYTSAITNAQ